MWKFLLFCVGFWFMSLAAVNLFNLGVGVARVYVISTTPVFSPVE